MKKICPFNFKTTEIDQTVYEYDEEGRVVYTEDIIVADTENTDCKEEGCAMWQKGKCVRKG